MIVFLILFICGIFAGTIAGLFGVGGGILFTPILFYLFSLFGLENPAVWAIATSLLCTFMSSLSSTIQQRNEQNLHWREGLVVGLFGTAGIYLGKLIVLSSWYTDKVFVLIFAILLIFVAILYIRRSRKVETVVNLDDDINTFQSAGTGAAGGFAASLAGIGGGVVMVPTMNLVFRLDLSKSVSISSFAIVLISLSGWIQYALFAGSPVGVTEFTVGYVDFGTALPLLIGAFTGGFLGVKAGVSLSGQITNILFAILLFSIAAFMLRSLM